MVLPRPRSVAVVASLALAVTAGATVALVTRGPRPTASLAPAVDEPVVTSPTPSESPSPSPSPTPSPTPTPSRSAAPAPSPSEEPKTASPTTAAAVGLADFGPRSPGSVTAPYRAGQTSWDLTSNGIRILVTMTPAKAGSEMTWTVRASGVAKCCAITVLFGDGFQRATDTGCGESVTRATFPHTYNKGGRKEFLISARGATCGTDHSGVIYGQFDVAAGPSTPQGPELPVVQFADAGPVKGHAKDPHYVSLSADVHDYDGHIVKFVVDFGDGSPKKTFQPQTVDCQRSMDGWPTGTQAWLKYDPPPYHYFAKPGTYTLTLTAYSASCDGAMLQTGSDSFTWTVPGPEPSEAA